MKKRTKFATLALASALMMTPNAVHATSGSWDKIGSNSNYFIVGSSFESGVIYSGGGDFAVDFTSIGGGGQFQVTLYETDDGGATSDYITMVKTDSNNMAIFRYLSGWVDGDNGKAEFMVKITKISGSAGTASWDYLD